MIENEILNYHSRIQEIKESIIIAIDSDMILWNLNNIVVDNIEYFDTTSYINSITYELKILLRNLIVLDQFSGTNLKNEIISEIGSINTNETKNRILILIT